MSRHFIAGGFALLAMPACGSEAIGTADQAIIGGETATPAEFPSVVALENSPGNWFCTGTLIDRDWVLTAAHCVVGETAAGVKVRFDDANINDTAGGKVVAVAEIHGHPGFVEVVWDNDIALIKLATSVTDREPTVIDRTMFAAATSITEVGYGDSDNNGGGSGVLRKLVTSTISCASTGDPALSDANLLCLDPRSGRASCDGDSGGPAFVMVGGKLVVAGVNSGVTGDTRPAGSSTRRWPARSTSSTCTSVHRIRTPTQTTQPVLRPTRAAAREVPSPACS